MDLRPTKTETEPLPTLPPLVRTGSNRILSDTHDASEIFSHLGDQTKLVLVMVGLPARGKSFISRKVSAYLSWLGIKVKFFNVGNYRRLCAQDTVGKASESFFDPSNAEASKRRELFALLALIELESFLKNGGQVAILDGTNSTRERRSLIRNFFDREPNSKMNLKTIFIESICNDEKIIEQNILNVKVSSPDYCDVPSHEAIADFKKRIQHYERSYQTVEENDGSYIKLINAGKQVIAHNINGYLPARIMYFMMHINLRKVPIFLTRHGESDYNIDDRIGGDSSLSKAGKRFAKSMCDFITLQPEFKDNITVWCSTLKRTVETAEPFRQLKNVKVPILQWRALCEIEAGTMDGLTYEEINAKYPQEYAARQKDKLGYRYPQGESYRDVIQRLEPVIFELERSNKPILLISHRAVLRCLYAYFLNMPVAEIPHIDIDLHTVYKLTPSDYATKVDKFPFGFVVAKDEIVKETPEKDYEDKKKSTIELLLPHCDQSPLQSYQMENYYLNNILNNSQQNNNNNNGTNIKNTTNTNNTNNIKHTPNINTVINSNNNNK